jgi:hypothetical protein
VLVLESNPGLWTWGRSSFGKSKWPCDRILINATHAKPLPKLSNRMLTRFITTVSTLCAKETVRETKLKAPSLLMALPNNQNLLTKTGLRATLHMRLKARDH